MEEEEIAVVKAVGMSLVKEEGGMAKVAVISETKANLMATMISNTRMATL